MGGWNFSDPRKISNLLYSVLELAVIHAMATDKYHKSYCEELPGQWKGRDEPYQ